MAKTAQFGGFNLFKAIGSLFETNPELDNLKVTLDAKSRERARRERLLRERSHSRSFSPQSWSDEALEQEALPPAVSDGMPYPVYPGRRDHRLR